MDLNRFTRAYARAFTLHARVRGLKTTLRACPRSRAQNNASCMPAFAGSSQRYVHARVRGLKTTFRACPRSRAQNNVTCMPAFAGSKQRYVHARVRELKTTFRACPGSRAQNIVLSTPGFAGSYVHNDHTQMNDSESMISGSTFAGSSFAAVLPSVSGSTARYFFASVTMSASTCGYWISFFCCR